jgi:hypothetical protein
MLKNGRALEPPRERRMTTMIYPRGGVHIAQFKKFEMKQGHKFFQRLRHATGHPASDTLKSR